MQKVRPKALKSVSDSLVFCEKEKADFSFSKSGLKILLSLFSVGVNSNWELEAGQSDSFTSLC